MNWKAILQINLSFKTASENTCYVMNWVVGGQRNLIKKVPCFYTVIKIEAGDFFKKRGVKKRKRDEQFKKTIVSLALVCVSVLPISLFFENTCCKEVDALYEYVANPRLWIFDSRKLWREKEEKYLADIWREQVKTGFKISEIMKKIWKFWKIRKKLLYKMYIIDIIFNKSFGHNKRRYF